MVELFLNYSKPTKVGYFHRTRQEDKVIHKSLIQDIVEDTQYSTGCPSVASLNKRVFNVYPMFDIDVEFFINEYEEPEYKYIIDTTNFHTNNEVHQMIKQLLVTQIINDGRVALQLTDIHKFVTDDKDLELMIVPSDYLNPRNCKFVTGVFKPYGWLRPVNAAYIQENKKKPSKLTIRTDKPMLKIIFNKPVDLKRITASKEILDYEENIFAITKYRKKINKIYPSILSKRPKRLL